MNEIHFDLSQEAASAVTKKPEKAKATRFLKIWILEN
jgi:hypothetical protein